MNILLEKARRMLEENIIPFWQGLRDDEYGGYVGHVDFSMHSDCKAEKGCILHSRILWFFSEAALLLNRMDLAADAEHVYSFFTQQWTPQSIPIIRHLPCMRYLLTIA